ncbi:MAG: saccharopine dehydrogenase NADP-binding domain-containing protein [Polyangiales bacterium]
MSNDRSLDIVVFGATGFTGGLVAEYLAAHGAREGLRWALAGRDRDKLAAVRARLPSGGHEPELILAEASDAGALKRLAERTRVVLTTVGPYIRYGEPLVAACAAAGTHYVDLTGEPPFVALTRARHHQTAQKNRAKIVHACGFDSVPHDLGAWFTLNALRRRMSDRERAESAVTIEGIVRTKGTISGGTWHSALEIMASRGKGEKETANSAATPGREIHGLPPRVRYRKELGLWTVPMPTIDPLMVLASARLLPEYGPDFKYGHYLGVRNFPQVAGLFWGIGTVAALAQLKPTRSLLEKLKMPGEGPDPETRAKSWFRVLFEARAGAHHVRCEVRGGDPGYGETSKMIAECALTLARDADRLPAHFGIVPPAAALGAPLVERLTRAGLVFEELDADASPSRARREAGLQTDAR